MSVVTICVFHPIVGLADTDLGEQVLSVSPDGMFQLRRLRAGPGELGEARKTLEITAPNGKVLYQWYSPLGATSAVWRQDSLYLAINDAPGIQGDQLWIFRLDLAANDGNRVAVVREPDGKRLLGEIQLRHGSFLSRVEKVSIRAIEWRDGRLWCAVSGNSVPKRHPTVRVPFYYLWVLAFSSESEPLIDEEWIRSAANKVPLHRD